jgi:hypothetical protein
VSKKGACKRKRKKWGQCDSVGDGCAYVERIVMARWRYFEGKTSLGIVGDIL